MVVDAPHRNAVPDIELARLLIRTGKPLFLAVNKVDTRQAAQRSPMSSIGSASASCFPSPPKMAAVSDDLLDAILEMLPPSKRSTDARRTTEGTPEDHTRVIELPKVARNQGCHHRPSQRRQIHPAEPADRERQRSIVSPIPGTTRDAVDEIVEHDGQTFRFIDTAGIRRKGKTHLMAEKLSVVMARKHLEAADIALLVIDATEGVSAARRHHRRIRPRERPLRHHHRQQVGFGHQRQGRAVPSANQSRAHAGEQAAGRSRRLRRTICATR